VQADASQRSGRTKDPIALDGNVSAGVYFAKRTVWKGWNYLERECLSLRIAGARSRALHEEAVDIQERQHLRGRV
jgi:hypothetical protein